MKLIIKGVASHTQLKLLIHSLVFMCMLEQYEIHVNEFVMLLKRVEVFVWVHHTAFSSRRGFFVKYKDSKCDGRFFTLPKFYYALYHRSNFSFEWSSVKNLYLMHSQVKVKLKLQLILEFETGIFHFQFYHH